MSKVFIALGTNLGDRAGELRAAIALLGQHVDVARRSSVWETEPVGYADQGTFYNMVVQADTVLGPRALLSRLMEIEAALGRHRTFRNAPRVIDLDILLFDDVVMDEPGLSIPHPRMTDRAFVLAPLLEVDPHVVHPVSHERLSDILARGTFEHVERLGDLNDL